MASKIKFKCELCDFQFTDSALIFYFDGEEIFEEVLKFSSSKAMENSYLSGFVYESYCPYCQETIKTYVPENHLSSLTTMEINKLLKDNIDENTSQILFLDFQNSTGVERRNILRNGLCPNCKENISLIFDSNNNCPKCGSNINEII